jgi:hypothetical protein
LFLLLAFCLSTCVSSFYSVCSNFPPFVVLSVHLSLLLREPFVLFLLIVIFLLSSFLSSQLIFLLLESNLLE